MKFFRTFVAVPVSNKNAMLIDFVKVLRYKDL